MVLQCPDVQDMQDAVNRVLNFLVIDLSGLWSFDVSTGLVDQSSLELSMCLWVLDEHYT